jgi:hypothetical protein
MKFVSLSIERTRQRDKVDKPSQARVERFTKPITAPHEISTYNELRQQIHHDLRIQHPEWVQPNGESTMCDAYEARPHETALSYEIMIARVLVLRLDLN